MPVTASLRTGLGAVSPGHHAPEIVFAVTSIKQAISDKRAGLRVASLSAAGLFHSDDSSAHGSETANNSLIPPGMPDARHVRCCLFCISKRYSLLQMDLLVHILPFRTFSKLNLGLGSAKISLSIPTGPFYVTQWDWELVDLSIRPFYAFVYISLHYRMQASH